MSLKVFKNYPDITTPINANNLNNNFNELAELNDSKLNISNKAIGSEITTGTNDTKYVTPKAMKDAGINVKPKIKIITFSRDGAGSTETVSYTGVGFKPRRLDAIMVVPNTIYHSMGFSDENKSCSSVFQSSSTGYHDNGTNLIMYSNQASWVQGASVKSYDNDGFTLTWSKVGSPPTGTMNIKIICYE